MNSNKIDDNFGLNGIKSKNYLENIKSIFTIKNIFQNLRKNIALNIIKYNKKIQNRLNIEINNYIQLSVIKIEIIPSKNKIGEFINIINKEEESYYHIYFNGKKKQIQRYKIENNENVNKIRIVIDYKVKSLYKLFSCCECIESIHFTNFHRENITNMSFMFYKCSSLKELIFTNFTTNNVTDMRCMFFDCKLLKKLDLSNFNTERVINMSWMFNNCSSLKELNISSFDTENVTNMQEMFSGCSAIKELKISEFNTDNVNIMKGLLIGCSNELKEKILRQLNDKQINEALYY